MISSLVLIYNKASVGIGATENHVPRKYIGLPKFVGDSKDAKKKNLSLK